MTLHIWLSLSQSGAGGHVLRLGLYPDILKELIIKVHGNTTVSMKEIQDKGLELTHRGLPIFQTLSLLKRYRHDEEFRKEFDRLLDRASL